MNAFVSDDDIRVEKNANGVDTYILDPYNPLNQQITEREIRELLNSYGITDPIYNFELYKRAFIHDSYIRRPLAENQQNNIIVAPKPDDCLPLYTKSNQTLEFVGDGVLECITKLYLYYRFPKEGEGFMTEKKIELVKNESIGRMAYEMGLHKWFILSKHAELKQTRTNMKKLGCLFEAFVGAIFLDFNKVQVEDSHGWFQHKFLMGPGFQFVQVFIHKVFERHVDWTNLISTDNNYKNRLQVMIQKEFKVTPHYLEMAEYDVEKGYRMGVYLCLGQKIHDAKESDKVLASAFSNYREIHEYMSIHKRIFLYLGEGSHKIKKKAEQIACQNAIYLLKDF